MAGAFFPCAWARSATDIVPATPCAPSARPQAAQNRHSRTGLGHCPLWPKGRASRYTQPCNLWAGPPTARWRTNAALQHCAALRRHAQLGIVGQSRPPDLPCNHKQSNPNRMLSAKLRPPETSGEATERSPNQDTQLNAAAWAEIRTKRAQSHNHNPKSPKSENPTATTPPKPRQNPAKTPAEFWGHENRPPLKFGPQNRRFRWISPNNGISRQNPPEPRQNSAKTPLHLRAFAFHTRRSLQIA